MTFYIYYSIQVFKHTSYMQIHTHTHTITHANRQSIVNIMTKLLYWNCFATIIIIGTSLQCSYANNQQIGESLEIYLKHQLLNGELKDILFSENHIYVNNNNNNNDKNNNENNKHDILSSSSSSASSALSVSQQHAKIVRVVNKYMEHHLVKKPAITRGTTSVFRASPPSLLELETFSREKFRVGTNTNGIVKGIKAICQRRLNYYLSNCAIGPPLRKVNDPRLAGPGA